MTPSREPSHYIMECGDIYNLTVTSNTSALEGWCCGVAAISGADDREQTLSHEFSSISCGDDGMLEITANTTAMEGFVCGLGIRASGAGKSSLTQTNAGQSSSTQTNAASDLAPRWTQFFILLSFFLQYFT
ncbi:LAQU0S17e02190g1_1 [Lachancea quebecensis]|uniref:LAQU0S17e02190g1_1 n=1 Tax=Lachancea quebecensis TaxID=1654605 RepID=A0A0P1KX38_9SACH|nr:LAQU0S17e02190g1_1 [Lachancea quebecensis]